MPRRVVTIVFDVEDDEQLFHEMQDVVENCHVVEWAIMEATEIDIDAIERGQGHSRVRQIQEDQINESGRSDPFITRDCTGDKGNVPHSQANE